MPIGGGAALRRTLSGADADLTEKLAQYTADRWIAARERGLTPEAAGAQARADLVEWRGRPLPARRSAVRRANAWIGAGR